MPFVDNKEYINHQMTQHQNIASNLFAGGVRPPACLCPSTSRPNTPLKDKIKSDCDNLELEACWAYKDGHSVPQGEEFPEVVICNGDKSRVEPSHFSDGDNGVLDIYRTPCIKSRMGVDQVQGYKQSNLVDIMSPFIPMMRQKEAASTPAKGQRVVKVKALEAAKMTKLLQERKQKQRDERKAAFKRERERLEQEKTRRLELEDMKRKEEERKKEIDTNARKRQREAVENEKRKRRHLEMTKKRQREQDEIEKHVKRIRYQAADERDRKQKEVGKPAHEQLKSKKVRKSKEAKPISSKPVVDLRLAWEDLKHDWDCLVAKHDSRVINDTEKVVDEPRTPETFQIWSDEVAEIQSYEMSPYMDSDIEFEFRQEEELRNREGKFVPQWARKENLNQIILANQDLDPSAIFAKKRSVNLDEFLGPRKEAPFKCETELHPISLDNMETKEDCQSSAPDLGPQEGEERNTVWLSGILD